jgi:phage tail sheath protein FI
MAEYNAALWTRVIRQVSEFLIRLWRNGAFPGAKPEEAFFVKCDQTTMTPDDIDNGRLICLIGIAPVRSSEFVIFRISQQCRGI